jgi:aspartate carbamoyltransferase regulatory subunit
MEKELKVAALRSGTVIDHIPADKLFKVVSILQLKNSDCPITIGNNLESKHTGTKGIIKISDRVLSDDETGKIALVAPNATINIIEDYQVVEKRPLVPGEEVHDLVFCANPVCITNHQPVPTNFYVLNEEGVVKLKCRYCEREFLREEIKLKK